MEQYDDIPLLKARLFRILCLRDSQMNLFWRSNLDCSESPSHIGRFLHDYCGNQAGRNAGRKRWSFPYLPDARLPEVADRLTSFTPDYIVSKFMYKGGCQQFHVISPLLSRVTTNDRNASTWRSPKKATKVRPALKFHGIFIDFLLCVISNIAVFSPRIWASRVLSHENPQTYWSLLEGPKVVGFQVLIDMEVHFHF